MKFSLNTTRRFNEKFQTTGDVTAIGLDMLLEKIGAQLGAIDEVTDLSQKYAGIVTVKVVSCEKHPNANKLSLCLIDDGGVVQNVDRNEQDLVQVVCGAPNVRGGMVAVWIPPGLTVPVSYGKDPFVLETREIRGQKSNGMLASPKELDISDSHAGILELEEKIEPGQSFAELTGLDDIIIDIENKMFTHRPDLFGFLGIARELAGIQGMSFKSPEWFVSQPEFAKSNDDNLPFTVRNDLPGLVPRFTAIAMSDVKVGPSPLWLQVFLSEMGQKSINNIVDYTNFYMLETGQPLHAYDYDKVKSLSGGEPIILIRKAQPNERLKLLSGKEISAGADDIIIATDQRAIGVGGIMGGAETEVSESTTNIILECANFDMYNVRRTMMKHGLFSDAATRFTKGQSPLQNLAVLAKIVDEIVANGSGQVSGEVIDVNHVDTLAQDRDSLHAPITLSVRFINDRLGLDLSGEDMRVLLTNVEFRVERKENELTVTAPFWRTDIELPEDIVEEIGRLYGYDHLPLELPKRRLTPAPKDKLLEIKSQVRRSLSKAGANEVLTYSFVHGSMLAEVGQDNTKAFQIANALSPDLQFYRLSLAPSLLEKVHPNIKAGFDKFALFEIGKTHNIDYTDGEGIPRDVEKTSLVFASSAKDKSYTGAAYFQAKQFLEQLAKDCGISLKYGPLDKEAAYQMAKPFDPARTADVFNANSGESIGLIGEFKASVRKALKLPTTTAGFEIATSKLLTSATSSYTPLPRFPKVTQDITLRVAADLPYQQLFEFVQAELNRAQSENSLSKLSPLDIYQSDKDKSHKNISLRLEIAHYDRTLTDEEVNKLLDEVGAAAKAALGAERI